MLCYVKSVNKFLFNAFIYCNFATRPYTSLRKQYVVWVDLNICLYPLL